MGIRSFTLWTLLLTVASLVPSIALGRPINLDRYPVCEASAAIEVPCVDDPKANCIWVGNAEVGDIEALVQDEKARHWLAQPQE